MHYVLRLTLVITLCTAQDPERLKEIFGSPDDPGNQFNRLVEVTTKKSLGLSALQKCGEATGLADRWLCVPYHMCDNKTIVDNGITSGFGLIDVRLGDSDVTDPSEMPCNHYLDVCCRDSGGGAGERKPDTGGPFIDEGTPVPPPQAPPTPRPSSLRCGIRNVNGIDFKITGNTDEAEYGEFPWMVAILNRTNLVCGGSLITPNVVLTGAHCVADLPLGAYRVRAGEWDTQTEKERLPYQERTVREAIVHEYYLSKVLYNNVALLVLSPPFSQADNIGTVCLPAQDEVLSSKECFASGWGKDVFGKSGKYQVILKKRQLPIVPFDSCERTLRTTRLGANFELHRSFLCAGGQKGVDLCTGDGGGPLVCPDPRTPGRYVQAGIVSWGIGCGQENVPGVYADVAKFRNWIDAKLAQLNIKTTDY
ncbi:LOW QUALITY PROTEIN: phenoloxidase-activating factor 2-like [Anthonomus grandis grandis]|uniref:LOW QUALITY PROTEIN: phenoloxidase-activating factor 2-like n=1 Tax=Anthonomus grandis grandis TaxID=2921223 RepID=UPI002165F595|nr:LOW QUALITY PROTEIN: phenoloxidase-activating factor 2-like [Anthonomus grandis grandis]